MSLPTLISTQFYVSDGTAPYFKVGQMAVDTNGNRYRYVKVGGSNLVTANLLQEPAEDTQFVSQSVPTAVAVGQNKVRVTNGTTTVAAGDFVNGRFTVSTSTGIGQSFYIVNHTTGGSGAAITYTLDRPLLIALDTNSKVSIRKNPYNGVIQSPATTQTGGPVGFALFATPSANYAWIQSGGDTAVLFDTGANTANDALGIAPSVAVAGSVKATPSAAGANNIGYSRQVASVDSTVSLAHIIID